LNKWTSSIILTVLFFFLFQGPSAFSNFDPFVYDAIQSNGGEIANLAEVTSKFSLGSDEAILRAKMDQQFEASLRKNNFQRSNAGTMDNIQEEEGMDSYLESINDEYSEPSRSRAFRGRK
jgi:hypothetical protein